MQPAHFIGGGSRLLGAGLFYVNRIRVHEADIVWPCPQASASARLTAAITA